MALTYDEEVFLKASITQTLVIPVADLAAAADIAARPVHVNSGQRMVIDTVDILTQGAPAGVDDSNTVLVSLLNGTNAIVAKTYNTATQPPSSAAGSLGTPDATYRTVDAGGLLKLTVTQGGTTSDMPAFLVIVRYRLVS